MIKLHGMKNINIKVEGKIILSCKICIDFNPDSSGELIQRCPLKETCTKVLLSRMLGCYDVRLC
jgi:hypothetical protein